MKALVNAQMASKISNKAADEQFESILASAANQINWALLVQKVRRVDICVDDISSSAVFKLMEALQKKKYTVYRHTRRRHRVWAESSETQILTVSW